MNNNDDIKKEIDQQSRLFFEKTLFEYYNDLESLLFAGEAISQQAITDLNKRFRAKVKLINAGRRKLKLSQFHIPIFFKGSF